MIIDAWTFDVGTTEDHVEAIASRVEQSWDAGAEIVLFPEYCWAALPTGGEAGGRLPPLRAVAKRFWEEIMPGLKQRLARPGKMVVLGTAPCLVDGVMRNRSPIIVDGELIVQDKLVLTPWETEFSGGKALRIIQFGSLRIAVIICLDIEIPEICVLLRGQGIDLILVPSATETILGSERVTRCASARAVELGCAVVVCPIVGRCASDLVDYNVGKLACYLPAQAAFLETKRQTETVVFEGGFECLRSELNFLSLKDMREAAQETNPSLISSTKIEPLALSSL